MEERILTQNDLCTASKAVSMLSADAVERAGSGHPGMPMGVSDLAVVLWLKHLRFNPKDPGWLNRDRFVLSNGHGSMLLYSLLHLSGYDVSLDDLKAFRQLGSLTPGHPESFVTPGVECTTGPLGQGISNAVGMSLAKELMAKRCNTSDFAPIDHRVFCLVGDGCLMEGISGEVSSLAGHLGLGNLIVLYDDNHISIAGSTKLSFTEDVLKRYDAYGWHTQSVDGHDFDAIDEAINAAVAEQDCPSFIAARTIIGKGSPNKANTSGVHGSPLGEDELALTKEALQWPTDSTFYIPDSVKDIFSARTRELKVNCYDVWKDSFSKWRDLNPDHDYRLEQLLGRVVPTDLLEKLIAALPQDGAPVATRKISGNLLQVAAREVSSLIGGSADLEPSTLTLIKGSKDVAQYSFAGRNIRFGVREHAMGAIMNGLSYYGGFIPYGATFLCFSDYMRPAIRIAALSHLPGLYIFTHDSVFLGEDGPTHQPVEHLAALRVIPNLYVFRPADGLETAVCYNMALLRDNGPSAFSLTRQSLPPIERLNGFDLSDIERGAYVAYQSYDDNTDPDVVFVATGSEVSLALETSRLLDDGLKELKVRVVSMPCWELYAEQSEEFRMQLIPKASKTVVIEAGVTTMWPGMIGANSDNLLVIGIDRFGISAPAEIIAEEFGFTPESVLSKINERFSF